MEATLDNGQPEKENERPLIGIDLDDVLLGFNEALTPWHNRTYGTSYTMDQLFDYDLSLIWQCSGEEAIRRVFEFYDTQEHKNALPIQGAIEALQLLARDYDLIVITSRPQSISGMTYQWIEQHFPGIFKEIYFTNMYTDEGNIPKAQICKQLGVSVFVDDALHHAIPIAEAGIPVILYDRPWNQEALPPHIYRCKQWQDGIELINILMEDGSILRG